MCAAAEKLLPDTASEPSEPLRNLTGEEQALYDRQIRLWGVEAQRKLSTSSILIYCDPTTLLAQELAKNVLLAGIARLVLCTHHVKRTSSTTTASPLLGGFLGDNPDGVVDALAQMNPLVDVSVVKEEPNVATFSAVCVVACTQKVELALAARARASRVPFMCGRVAGEVGWIFLDAGEQYIYTPAAKADGSAPSSAHAAYVAYPTAVAAPWGKEVRRAEFGWHVAHTLMAYEDSHGSQPSADPEDLDKVSSIYQRLCDERGAAHVRKDVVARAARASRFELPAVAAVVGGMWGRETIKIASGREAPLDEYNFFFFNAATNIGAVERVGPRPQ